MMSPTLPVDLLMATYLHEIAAKIEHVPKIVSQGLLGDPQLTEGLQRDLLHRIAMQAPLAAVCAALAAAGVAEDAAGLRARLDAVLEQRRGTATSAPQGGR